MPKMTQKELSVLEDQLSAEQLAIKKCRHYLAETDDPAVKHLCEAMVKKHQEHYETLLRYVRHNVDLQ